MNFWDTSAIVALLADETGTIAVRDLFRSDAEMAVWWGAPVECDSAIRRRSREGAASTQNVEAFTEGLARVARKWTEVEPSEHLRQRARRILAQHPLRAADALQLAAALDWADEETLDKGFVCLDARLAEAARREGFRIFPAG